MRHTQHPFPLVLVQLPFLSHLHSQQVGLIGLGWVLVPSVLLPGIRNARPSMWPVLANEMWREWGMCVCYVGVVGKGLPEGVPRSRQSLLPLDIARSVWDALELLLGWSWHGEEPQECPRSQPGPQGFLRRACPTYRLQVLWGNKSLCCLCQLGVEHSVTCSQSILVQRGNIQAPWREEVHKPTSQAGQGPVPVPVPPAPCAAVFSLHIALG